MEHIDDRHYLDPPCNSDAYTCHYCGDVVCWDDLAPDKLDHQCCWVCAREMDNPHRGARS